MVLNKDPERERADRGGARLTPWGHSLHWVPCQTDRSPPTLLFAFVLAVPPHLPRQSDKKMRCDRQGLINPRFPSKPRSRPLVFTAYLHFARIIAMGTGELLKLRKGREAGEIGCMKNERLCKGRGVEFIMEGT